MLERSFKSFAVLLYLIHRAVGFGRNTFSIRSHINDDEHWVGAKSSKQFFNLQVSSPDARPRAVETNDSFASYIVHEKPHYQPSEGCKLGHLPLTFLNIRAIVSR
jgi:hypothetical protein